jgi:hypothetical protein
MNVAQVAGGAEVPARSSEVLSPLDRTSEVLFGLIMALTFTGSLSVATADQAEVRECSSALSAATSPGAWWMR